MTLETYLLQIRKISGLSVINGRRTVYQGQEQVLNLDRGSNYELALYNNLFGIDDRRRLLC